MKKSVILLTLSLAVTYAYYNSSLKNPEVSSPLGQFRGSLMESRLGRTIYAFRGIRYAKPPVGDLRFQPPAAIEPHQGIYDATENKPLCPQPEEDEVDEDCLVLNVYSTKLPAENDNVQRPVIVFIHPGGYYSGGGATYWAGPEYYTDQDIVLVTFNYRLGTLGFLSTGDKYAPGNNGLKDQVQVLRWIQQNIEAFGGDKNSVTIQGYSAGSISVILHMLSPMSKGLFHKAIAMSGAPTAQWLIESDLMALARKQAKFVGCPSDGTSEEIVKCLKTIPYKQLGDSLDLFDEFGYNPVLVWLPVVEADFGQERFLIEQPVTLIQNKAFQQIPLITGVTKDEFDWKALQILDNATLTKELEQNWEINAPIIFQYERDTDLSKNASRALKKFYLNDQPVANNSETLIGLGNLYAEGVIGFGVNRAVKLLSQYSSLPVYYYEFTYQGRYSYIYTAESNYTEPYGVVHHDDLIYLFYISKLFPKFEASTPVEIEMVAKLTKLYSNFATYGNPIPAPSSDLDNVTWDPLTIDNLRYLDIGKTLKMKEKLFEDRYNKWDKLFPLEHFTKK